MTELTLVNAAEAINALKLQLAVAEARAADLERRLHTPQFVGLHDGGCYDYLDTNEIADDMDLRPGQMRQPDYANRETAVPWYVHVVVSRCDDGTPDETAVYMCMTREEAEQALVDAGHALDDPGTPC